MKNILFATFIGAAFLLPAIHAEGPIQARKEEQQKRIAQGVASGQLTPGETAKLEKKEANLNRKVRNERKANGGNLTNKEKAQVNRRQNQISRDIYKEKHDSQKAPK